MDIQIRQLSKRYRSTPALAGISLDIPPGNILAVIGLNGAGKTTLLRCLSGIAAPTRGEVLYDGERFSRARLDQRKRLCFLPDFPPLYGNLNALQHFAMMLRVYERATTGVEDRALALLRDFDLLPLAESPIGTLSRGQIYKVALCGLMLVEPELWLLDEPFASGLDPQGLAMLKHHAREAAGKGATMIYSTQILEVAEKFCDILLVIDQGQLRSTYTRDQLDALPKDGSESLESRLRQFREVAR